MNQASGTLSRCSRKECYCATKIPAMTVVTLVSLSGVARGALASVQPPGVARAPSPASIAFLSHNQPNPNVARRGVHRMGHARRGSIAPAIVCSAQE